MTPPPDPTHGFLYGASVLTPEGFRSDLGVLVRGGRIEALQHQPPPGVPRVELQGGLLLPGFVDCQCNGGGGVLLNDEPTLEGMAHIAAAHRRFGSTALLPTLITDEPEVVERALAAADAAVAAGVPGVWGLHLEGPCLNPKRRGVHDATRMRALDETLLQRLCAPRRGVLMVTLAPECVSPGAVRRLSEAGVIVSAGHSEARYEQVRAALGEGLRGFTHLFNAMSPLQGREPGMVGAALEDRASWCGLIADVQHVHPASLRLALAAKGPEHCVLVTDAMPVVGSEHNSFMLGGRRIALRDGRLTDEQGTLAGSAIDMASAVRNTVHWLGQNRATAVRMASAHPARFLRIDDRTGSIAPGLRADLVHCDEQLHVQRSWIGGR